MFIDIIEKYTNEIKYLKISRVYKSKLLEYSSYAINLVEEQFKRMKVKKLI